MPRVNVADGSFVPGPNINRLSILELVTGRICLRLGDQFFLERDWSDFPVVVLGWWIQAFLKIHSGAENEVDCLFMDGPLAFRLTRVGPDMLEIRVGNRDGERRALGKVAVRELAKSLSQAAQQVLEACAASGWEAQDIEILRKEREVLRRSSNN